eukprot:CAMPEP_0168317224 /NCGR_PEP_ID=MMETSP0210-20121227/23273_1 /TAXON_ID=40633 /ORGANISM="Condylostoma magnum, Strain COL2" /LENGTH=69 /DNA_ID=CAMNT_0008312659 /DNA_START=260 /DNA_END=469 /DNA_ORIENTATION=+
MRPELTSELLSQIEKDDILAFIGPYRTDVALEYTMRQEKDSTFRPTISYGSEYEQFSYSGDYPAFLRTV